jgi:integrase
LLSCISIACFASSPSACNSFGAAIPLLFILNGAEVAHGLILVPCDTTSPAPVDPRLLRLKRSVLDSVVAANSKRNHAKALDHLFAFAANRPLSRELMLEWRASMEKQSPSTVNVRLSAMRSLVAEARRAGMLSSEDAEKLSDIPNIKQAGARKGNWLTREQAKELLAVPDRSKLKGKRDYVILSLLVACALEGPNSPSSISRRFSRGKDVGCWPISKGRGRRIRTVAIPIWVKQGIDAWTTAANIKEGRLLRPIRKGGKIDGEILTDWAIWSVVEKAAKQIGIERFGAHDLRRTCAKLCRKAGGDIEQIKFLLGHSSIQTTERYLGSEQEIVVAVNDNLGI